MKLCRCGNKIGDKRCKLCILCEIKEYNLKNANMVSAKCSNCGYENIYKASKYKSREETKCRSCRRPLSICRWMI